MLKLGVHGKEGGGPSSVRQVVPQIEQENSGGPAEPCLYAYLTFTDPAGLGYLDFSASCFSNLMDIGRSGNTLVFGNKKFLT